MRFDVIIHLAGFLGVKKSTVSELECIETNLQGTINILRLSKITKNKTNNLCSHPQRNVWRYFKKTL